MKNTPGSFLPIRVCSVAILFLLSIMAARSQFVAFNGSAPGPATAANTTAWNIFGDPPGTTGPLKDINSGAVLPVTVTITTNGAISPAAAGAGPLPGTPLYNTFHSFVD